MKMKSKVYRGVLLGLCLPHAVEINLSGSGKCNLVMILNVLRCCKVTHRMSRWCSGILFTMFLFLSAMTTLLRCNIVDIIILILEIEPRLSITWFSVDWFIIWCRARCGQRMVTIGSACKH